ncbi:MAG: oligosaccharide flippase family protein [Actinomycetota bacterium]|nr:oligosaccharide flippase family protein [Actinomycetota bacterium]
MPAISPSTEPGGLEEALPGRRDVDDAGLRARTARGTIVNAVFLIALYTLGLLKGFVVAALLTANDYGIWGIVMVGLGAVAWLRTVGVNDKYIQQDEADQELAFQKAFTLELLFTTLFIVAAIAAVPLIALAYGQDKVVVPALVAIAAFPAMVFQSPLWVFYRRMEFVRQRKLQAVDPIVSFVATMVLALAGAGYWSLIIGFVAGTWAAAIAAVRASPYRLSLRYDRGTMREYFAFSWPLAVASLSGVVIAQVAVLTGSRVLGLAGAGAITLASSIAAYADRVDEILTTTLYPAICAVQHRIDLLMESFVKSNRLALMWGMPFGIAVALFTPDVVQFVLGDRWRPAETLIQAFGLIAAVNHIGFNWSAYYRARGQTRPIAVVNAAMSVTFAASAIPLLIVDGLEGLAIGMALMCLVGLCGRFFYLTQLFPGFALARHIARAIAPSVPPVIAVLAVRAVEGAHRRPLQAVGEVVLYLVVTALSTFLLERVLLREVIGYLRGTAGREPGVAA